MTASATTKCTTARDKFLKLINSQRFKAKAITPALGSSLAINSCGTGSSGSSPSSSSLATTLQLHKKKKVKSKQIPPTKKTFQWLHNYFKVDPDFHENLSQQTTIPMMGRRNSASSVSGGAGRIHLNSIGSTTSGSGIRAGSVEKVGLLLESTTEDDLHFVGIGPKNRLSSSVDSAHGDDSILMEYRLRKPASSTATAADGNSCVGELKIIPLGTSPVDKAIRNIVDIGTQLSARDLKFQFNDDDEPLVLLTKKPSPLSMIDDVNCSSSQPEKSTINDLCVFYSNMTCLQNNQQKPSDNDDGFASTQNNIKHNNNCDTNKKCPLSHSDILDLKPAITQRMLLRPQLAEHSLQRNYSSTLTETKCDGIVIAKPIEPQLIGFNLETVKESVVSPNPNPNSSPITNQKTLPPPPPSPLDEDCDVFDSSSTFKATPARRKPPSGASSSDSVLNLIIIKSGDTPGGTRISGGGVGGGCGGDNDTDCCTPSSPNRVKASGSSSSSSGYCGASEGSQSISSTSSSGVVDNLSSSSTTFSLERNSLDGGSSCGSSSAVMLLDSKKKLSLPTPEIEKGAGEIGMTNNRSSSYSYNHSIINSNNNSNNNNNHSNISTFLESTFATAAAAAAVAASSTLSSPSTSSRTSSASSSSSSIDK